MLNLPRLAENYKLKQNQWAKEKWSGLESVRSVRCCEDNCVLWQRCGLLSITLSISSHCQLREFEIARSAILIVDVLWQAMCWLNSLYFLFSCKYIHTHVYYSVFTGNVHVCVMPSSLHRRTQDTLVSSRPWCEQNWYKSRLFSVVLAAFRDWPKQFRKFPSPTILTYHHFCSHRWHGQDEFHVGGVTRRNNVCKKEYCIGTE